VGNGLTRKLNKKSRWRTGCHYIRKEGVENLQLVEDQNLNSYRVRCSKHDLISYFKFDNELMPCCELD
jgi:hypothetical protein